MPRSLRDPIVRSQLNISNETIPGVTIKIAETKEEYEGAFKLLHDSYLETDLINATRSGLRVTKYHSLPTTQVIVVKLYDEVVGTMSIIMDNPLGLPIDALCDISHIRKKASRIAEISALAIKRDDKTRRGKLLIPLTTFMHRYCEEVAGIDALVCVVNESAKIFYEAAMCFDSLKLRKNTYSFVKAKEMCPLMTWVNPESQERARKVYDGKPKNKNLYYHRYVANGNVMHKFPTGNFHLATNAAIRKETLNYFFKEKSDTFKDLESNEMKVLRHTYVHPYLTDVLPGDDLPIERKNIRFPVNCSAKIASFSAGKILPVKILESSVEGFSFHTPEYLTEHEEFEILAQIGPGQKTKFKAKIIWENNDKTKFGAKIVGKAPKEWVEFHSYLKEKMYPDLAEFEKRFNDETIFNNIVNL